MGGLLHQARAEYHKTSDLKEHRGLQECFEENPILIMTPANVFYGPGQVTLDRRETIKPDAVAICRKIHYDNRKNLNLTS